MQKGLVSTIRQNNRTVFSPSSPQRLINLLDEKKEALSQSLPSMLSLFSAHREEQEVSYFRGAKALKAVFDDQVADAKPILVINASVNASDIVRFYFERFDRARSEKRIPIRMLFDDSARKNPYLRKIPLADIRFLPEDFQNPMAVNIYGNKVVIVLWTDSPFAILIQNKTIADSYRTYFEYTWRKAKK